ncbi:hypothetical protein GQR58_018096 [Nymphon striatum]|nr:hypothetical protein GQR58_018096 [Nymphon striatum]
MSIILLLPRIIRRQTACDLEKCTENKFNIEEIDGACKKADDKENTNLYKDTSVVADFVIGSFMLECRIGKLTAYSTLIKNAHTLSDMKRFHEADMDTCISLARKFVRLMYGKKGKHLDSLNDLRFHFAATTDKPASMLPPTEDAFKQHILRANKVLITKIISRIGGLQDFTAEFTVTIVILIKPSTFHNHRATERSRSKGKTENRANQYPKQNAGKTSEIKFMLGKKAFNKKLVRRIKAKQIKIRNYSGYEERFAS